MSRFALHLEVGGAGRPPQPFAFPEGVYTIGRGESCRIRLRHPEVSDLHARLRVAPGACRIEDAGSRNGTRLNDAPVESGTLLAPGDVVAIGPFSLRVVPAATPESPSEAAPGGQSAEGASGPPASAAPSPNPTETAPREAAALKTLKREIKGQIHRELVQRLDLKRLSAARVNNQELQQRARETIDRIIQDVRGRLPPGISPEDLAREIFDEALRLGPLEKFLEDDAITEIMINGPHQVYVERNGRLEASPRDFMDEDSVLAVIERIVSPLGRRIDESQPYVDARLPDGSRVNAIIPPLSLVGPCLTIRKFSRIPFTEADMIRFETLTPAMARFLEACVRMRRNIVVSGGTGSGKTTFLNLLSRYLPPTDRIITIEDAAELRLEQPHLVRLEARPPNIEGRGAITIRDLVRNALRMRPDRIIVGECRGGEALDMLQAMNTGHDGSLTTVHANSPRDVVSRLETMVLMAGMDLPSRAIREQIASALDVVVHESRLSDGSRKITAISEIVGLEGHQVTMQEIFEFERTGIGEDGKVLGRFRPTGILPSFFQELRSRGIELDPALFRPEPGGEAPS